MVRFSQTKWAFFNIQKVLFVFYYKSTKGSIRKEMECKCIDLERLARQFLHIQIKSRTKQSKRLKNLGLYINWKVAVWFHAVCFIVTIIISSFFSYLIS